MKTSIFNIGQMVKHKTQGYSAIIVDVDINFQPSGKLNPHIKPGQMKNQGPWYRLLVHQTKLITYVDESELEKIFMQISIHHPKLYEYLTIKSGQYRLKGKIH